MKVYHGETLFHTKFSARKILFFAFLITFRQTDLLPRYYISHKEVKDFRLDKMKGKNHPCASKLLTDFSIENF